MNAITPIEDHPQYALLVRLTTLQSRCETHNKTAALEASRWVAGLLATIVSNADLL